MTTPARIKEAEQASATFHVALTQIGVKTVEDALVLWQDVPATAKPAVAAKWLEQAIRLILFRRRNTRAIALSYYRLARALRTGRTIADPYHPEPTTVSLETLRAEFAELTGPFQPKASEQVADAALAAPQDDADTDSPEPTTDPQAGDVEPVEDVPADAPEDDDLVLVEELERLERDLARTEEIEERQIRDALQALGPDNMSRLLDDIDDEQPAKDADAARKEAHEKAGRRQAATAARSVMNGARSAVYTAGSRDKAVIGWIRLSRTGTPCGWCAMLLSRGVLYKSARKAGGADPADADKYHDNCNCYAEPVYGDDDYKTSDLFALNRRYAALWPQVTKGLGGEDALAAWRNFIRREQKAAKKAQAASANR